MEGQNPAAGTLVSCSQTVNVQLTYTPDGIEQRSARLPIVLIDATPPVLDASFQANIEPQTSFGGIARYVSPTGGAVVVPLVTVTDSCDQNPSLELFLNDQPYTLGTPVTSLGLYFLRARTTDAAGNLNENTFVFEIRQRPSYTAAAVVQSTQCEISPDGQTGTFDATVLISDDEFDHHDILLSSVRVFLMGADGKYLNTRAFPIAGGFQGDCPIFQPLYAQAEINLCWLEVRLQGTFVPDSGGCPESLDIIGAATSGIGDLSFEWGARSECGRRWGGADAVVAGRQARTVWATSATATAAAATTVRCNRDLRLRFEHVFDWSDTGSWSRLCRRIGKRCCTQRLGWDTVQR